MVTLALVVVELVELLELRVRLVFVDDVVSELELLPVAELDAIPV